MDDFPVIVNNPDIRSLGNFIINSFPGRPLREITFLLDYSFFGLDPFGYHFQNIFWHALNCWLVYLVAIRLNLSKAVAWLSSMLFLVHPVHVEVVANSSHRKDSLALAFMLMALLAYMKIFKQKRGSWRFFWFIGTVILWMGAFFSKGNSLIFPAIAIAYEYAIVPEKNRLLVRWRQMIPTLFVSSLIGLAAWYLYISTLPSFKMAIMSVFIKNESIASFSTSTYILMLLKSYAFMISKLIFPHNLSMEYIYSAPKSMFDPWVFSSLLLIPSLCIVAYRWKKSSPEYFFLFAFSALLWLPTANIVWPLSYFAADRYMYAPSAGLCILAVLISERTFHNARRYLVFGWICIFIVSAILTWRQTKVWDNQKSLNSNILRISPQSLEAMIGLSNAYHSEKEYDMAAKYARQAMQRDDTDERPLINLGSIYDEMGKTEEAIKLFKSALNKRPDNFHIYVNLGVVYERMNNLSEAESMLNKAISINNSNAPAWYNLGTVRYKNNNRQGARQAFSEAARLKPSDTDALTNLSIVCKELGDLDCFNDAMRKMGSNVPTAVEKLRP